MRVLKNLSIKSKLNVLVLAVSGAALLLASVALIVNDANLIRASKVQQLSALADVLGANSTATLTFDDPAAARELLSSLSLQPTVRFACLYNAKGRRITNISKTGEKVLRQFESGQWRTIVRCPAISASISEPPILSSPLTITRTVKGLSTSMRFSIALAAPPSRSDFSGPAKRSNAPGPNCARRSSRRIWSSQAACSPSSGRNDTPILPFFASAGCTVNTSRNDLLPVGRVVVSAILAASVRLS